MSEANLKKHWWNKSAAYHYNEDVETEYIIICNCCKHGIDKHEQNLMQSTTSESGGYWYMDPLLLKLIRSNPSLAKWNCSVNYGMNFSSIATTEVWEWRINSIQHFIVNVS